MISLLISFLLGFSILISFAILFYKWSINVTNAFWIIIGFAIFIFSFADVYLPYVIYPVIIGASAGISFRYKKTLQFFILFSTLLLTLILTANYYYLKEYKDTDLFAGSREKVIELIGQTPDIPKTEKDGLLLRVDDLLEAVQDIIPFTYFLNSLILSVIGLYIIKIIFLRFLSNIDLKEMRGIEYFNLNDYFVFVFISGWLIVLLVGKNVHDLAYIAGWNVALVLSILYLTQGAGIIRYFLIKKGLPVLLLPVGLFIIFFLGIEYVLFFSVILTSLGVFDLWADFRKLKEKNSANQGE